MATATMSDSAEQLARLGITEPVSSAATVQVVLRLAEVAGVAATGCPKEVGTLIYKLATSPKAKALPDTHREALARLIGARDVARNQQLEGGLAYLNTVLTASTVDVGELRKQSGVGVVVSADEIDAAARALVERERAAIAETRYRTNVGQFVRKLQTGPEGERLRWADGAALKGAIDAAIAQQLGPKTAEDLDDKAFKQKQKEKAKAAQPKAEGGAASKPAAAAAAAAASDDVSKGAERSFPAPSENRGEPPYALNSEALLRKHLEQTGGKVITRFPPEPNGYLHIGHAKAMNMNFGYARRTGGHTILRFDDTNPEAEEEEFFEMIKKEVTWLGHSPKCVTHSSSYFGQLHALAVQLIKSGDAYVCHQTQEEVRASRALLVEAHHQKGEVPAAAKSPWRDRSVEENLRWFERMRQGRVGEGEAFLRFKGDLAASNPNMWDLAAYRVKFTPHPGEGGREWCIYPTYDFTHCVIDSIENVTHSLCTLEFETRQAPEGSYYWLLDRLGMYKPATWEYGRLNLTHNVLSKRRLNLLVTQRLVNGWDDPRLLTLAGLRRRGYSSESINRFCETVGVTRVDGVLTRFEVLESTLRAELDASARRVMAVLRPLRVTIENLPAPVDLSARNHPKDEGMGTRTIRLTRTIYIDRSDFHMVDDPNYYGLAPDKEVGLKYAGFFVKCTDVILGADGQPAELRVRMDPDSASRAKKQQPKGVLQWVPDEGKVELAEVRLYDHLFTAENVGAEPDWLACFNSNSLEAVRGALAEPSVREAKPGDRMQFERVGFFVCDPDSGPPGLVFNRSVTLKEAKGKQDASKG